MDSNDSVLSSQYSAVSTQYSALSTQHSALFSQHFFLITHHSSLFGIATLSPPASRAARSSEKLPKPRTFPRESTHQSIVVRRHGFCAGRVSPFHSVQRSLE